MMENFVTRFLFYIFGKSMEIDVENTLLYRLCVTSTITIIREFTYCLISDSIDGSNGKSVIIAI